MTNFSKSDNTQKCSTINETRKKCLDKGFVELVDHMGSDQRIVNSARVSIEGEGVRPIQDDRSLIRYLMRHHHWSPFEQCMFTFRMKLPIFVARQFVRHRTAKINEVSGRYTVFEDDYYTPDVLSFQSKDNKQGSGSLLPNFLAKAVKNYISNVADSAYKAYSEMVQTDYHQRRIFHTSDSDYLSTYELYHLSDGGGLARELARMILPVNFYTTWYFTIDLRNLFNLLKLRMDSHAQSEARIYANAMYELIKDKVPLALEAFDDYILHGCHFSKQEMEIFRESVSPNLFMACLEDCESLSKREKQELRKKVGIDD